MPLAPKPGSSRSSGAWLRAGEGYSDLHMASSIEQRREAHCRPITWMASWRATQVFWRPIRPEAVYSISRLEQYARCPFSFFARYCLELEPALQDVPDYSALERGHAAALAAGKVLC